MTRSFEIWTFAGHDIACILYILYVQYPQLSMLMYFVFFQIKKLSFIAPYYTLYIYTIQFYNYIRS